MLIEADIGKRIKDYLYQNKEMNLPGMGIFRVYHIDQYLSNNDSIIHPPVVKVRFSQSQKAESTDEALTKYYYDQNVENQLESHFQHLINDVLNFGEAKIKGLGAIKRMKSGEIVFAPGDLLDVDSEYLPIIDTAAFQFAARPVHKDPKGRFQKPEARSRNMSASTFSPHFPKTKAENNTTQRAGLIGFSILGLILLLGAFLLCKHCMNENEISDQQGSEVIMSAPEKQLAQGIVEDELDYSKGMDFEGQGEKTNALRDDLASSGKQSCTIVVGSFRNQNNAQRLWNKLQSDGFNAVMLPYSNLTRVAVQFECNRRDLKNHLNEIQSNYEVNAWFLRSPMTL